MKVTALTSAQQFYLIVDIINAGCLKESLNKFKI